MDVTELFGRVDASGGGPRWRGGGFECRCPAHEDHRASCSVQPGADGRVLVRCHAGCSLDAVLSGWGVDVADLFPPRANGNGSGGDDWTPAGPAVATYRYVDEGGTLLFAVCRTAGKDFRQWQPDPTARSGKRWNLDGVRRVPYRLPAVRAAVAAGRRVWVVEGEKDVHAIEVRDEVATTNPGGAGKWRPEFGEHFVGAEVVVVADADEPGRRHARAVAVALGPVASSVRVVEPAVGKDVSDHLAAGRSLDELVPLADEDPPPAEPEDEGTGAPGPAWHLTDMGNAERLLARHGRDLHHVHPWGRWLVWDGRRWRDDDLGLAQARAKETARAIWDEAAAAPTTEQRKALRAWAGRSESAGSVSAMLNLARSGDDVAVLPDDLDADPWELCVLNGVLDLRTGELRDHERDALGTKLASVSWDPGATCPRWEAFVTWAACGDAELVAFLRRAVGYSLTARNTEQCLFVLWGSGDNGKSTFLETVQRILGDYAVQTPAETLLERREGGIPNDVARLRGARFISAVETDEGRRLSEGLVKRITGKDRIAARFLHAEWFEFEVVGKVWLGTNHKPTVRGTDHAIWRRIRLVPFLARIADGEKDRMLSDRLALESSGILRWAVEGCLEWQRIGLAPPAVVVAATAEYRAEQDRLAEFLSDCCVLDEQTWVLSGDLYRAYRAWSEEQGERHPWTQQYLGRQLTERGMRRGLVGPRRVRGWQGIALRDSGTGTMEF